MKLNRKQNEGKSAMKAKTKMQQQKTNEKYVGYWRANNYMNNYHVVQPTLFGIFISATTRFFYTLFNWIVEQLCYWSLDLFERILAVSTNTDVCIPFYFSRFFFLFSADFHSFFISHYLSLEWRWLQL